MGKHRKHYTPEEKVVDSSPAPGGESTGIRSLPGAEASADGLLSVVEGVL